MNTITHIESLTQMESILHQSQPWGGTSVDGIQEPVQIAQKSVRCKATIITPSPINHTPAGTRLFTLDGREIIIL